MFKRYNVDIVVDVDNIHEVIFSRSFTSFGRLLAYICRFRDSCSLLLFSVYDHKTGASFVIHSGEIIEV